MAAIPFRNKEAEYQRWLRGHPRGYVVTTLADIAPSYMSLHRSTCRMISQYMKNMAPDAFTGQDYMKICGNTPAELLSWIARHGGSGFSKRCSVCVPDVDGGFVDEVDAYNVQLDSDIQRSRRDSANMRLIRNLPQQAQLVSH